MALDASGIGTFVWHLADDRADCDPRMLMMLGLPYDAITSMSELLRILIHPSDREHCANAVERATDPLGRGVLREEIRVLRPGGAECWLAISGQTMFQPVFTEGGDGIGAWKAVRISGCAADVTRRKRREANVAFLADLGNDFARLSSATEIMHLAGAKAGAYLDLSSLYVIEMDDSRDEGRLLHAWRPTEMPGLPVVFRISDFTTERFSREAHAGEPIVVRDTSADPRVDRQAHLHANIRAAVSVPFIRNGKLKFLLCAGDAESRDWRDDEIDACHQLSMLLFPCLERAYAEEAVAGDLRDIRLLQTLSSQLIKEQDSSSFFDTLVDAATSIMRSEFATLQVFHPERGPAGELQLLSSRGFTEEARQQWQWVGPDSGSPCAAAIKTRVRMVAPDVANCEFLNGTEGQTLMLAGGVLAGQSTPLLARDGKMLGMISTHWRRRHRPSDGEFRMFDILARQAADLMERTQAQERLRVSEQQLQEADRRKDEFLAVLAHELRNPLAPLRTALELMRIAGDTPEALREFRGMMEEQVDHMVRLIDDLLDVSRITSGKIRLQCQPTTLTSVLNTAIEVNRDALRANDVVVSVALPDTTVVVDADPTRIVQVLSNILHNAVKFSERGGEIKIAVTVEPPHADETGQVAIVVADSGAGISKDMLPRVFELFTQQNEVTNREDKGLGIGLALARQLIELHGGSIVGHSDGPGLGSTFTIRLPLPKFPLEVPVSDPPPTPRITTRVLVVDDNVSAATAMRRLVTALGGDCRVAYDGEAGVKEALEFRPDLVFLDIAMPGLNGYDACRRIRDEVGSNVIVVALTGWGQDRDKLKAQDAGFDAHLTKPPDPLALEALLAAPATARQGSGATAPQ